MARAPRWLATALVAGLAAAAAFVVVNAAQPTAASWMASRTASVAVTAVVPAPPTALTCTSSSGVLFSPIPLTWTAPAGTVPSGYTLKWTGAATGSNTWPTTSGSVPAGALLGPITISVYADYGTWESAAGTVTRHGDIVGFGLLWGCT